MVSGKTGFKTFRIPGLAKDIPIPADIDVQVRLIESKRFRSYTKSTPSMLTVHDTGNSKTRAEGEYAWAAAGRPGGSVGGYVGIYDSQRVLITAPWDEDCWATATPRGNKISRSFEMAFGGGQDFEAVMQVGASLYGGLCAVLGWDPAKVLVQHHYWSGKDCPHQLRSKGLWPRFVQLVTTAKAEAEAFLGAVPIKPGAVYEKATKPWFWDVLFGNSDRTFAEQEGERWFRTNLLVKAVRATPRLAVAEVDSARRVGPDIGIGERFRLEALGFGKSGRPIGVTEWLTRVDLDDLRVIDEEAA